jgi:hypothetical protein
LNHAPVGRVGHWNRYGTNWQGWLGGGFLGRLGGFLAFAQSANDKRAKG